MARLRPQHTQLIVNTLLSLKNNGKAESTLKSVNECLTRISKNADLANPENVKTYIANAKKKNGEPIENASKVKLAFA